MDDDDGLPPSDESGSEPDVAEPEIQESTESEESVSSDEDAAYRVAETVLGEGKTSIHGQVQFRQLGDEPDGET